MTRDGSPRRFSPRRSVLFSFVLVAGFFACAEGALRVMGVRRPINRRLLLRSVDVDIEFPFMRPDNQLFWAPKPGWRGEFLGKRVTINSVGLRGPEPDEPKPAGRRRVACFGDSITFGYGVADEDTYAYQAGVALARYGVDVVNAGVTGYTSHQVLRLLKRVAPELKADVATFCIGWNDGTRRPIDDRTFERRLHAAQKVEVLMEHLYLYRLMKSLYLRALLSDTPAVAATPRVGLDHYRENLHAIVQECRARGIQPVFLQLPRRRRAGGPPESTPYENVLSGVADEMDVPLLPVGELGLQARGETNDQYFIDALHFSPAGHELMARQLVEALTARRILGVRAAGRAGGRAPGST